MKRNIAIFILAFSLATLARADTQIYAAPQLAAPYYNLGSTARATALGSAYVALADDSSSLFFNPAGLAWMEGPEIALHHNSWMVDTFQETLVAGMPLKPLGYAAISAAYMNWGTFDIRDQTGALGGDYSDRDLECSFGWATAWKGRGNQGLSLGLAIRGLKQRLYETAYTTASADFGLLWSPTSWLRLGAASDHLGPAIEDSPQASSLRLGACLYEMPLGQVCPAFAGRSRLPGAG